MKNSSIKLIIMDLDGVLVEACDWHRDAFLRAFKEVTGIEMSKEEHFKELNGLPTRKKLDKLGLVEADPDRKAISDLKQKYTEDLIWDNCNPNTQTRFLLRSLRLDHNLIIGCYTNCSRKTARMMINLSELSNDLDILLTNENVYKPKPDPEGYNRIMSTFLIKPEETAIVEDSEVGYQAALASKAHVIRVKDTSEVTVENILPKLLNL